MSAVDDRLRAKMPSVGTLPLLYNAVVVPKLLFEVGNRQSEKFQFEQEMGTIRLRFLVDNPDALFSEYRQRGVECLAGMVQRGTIVKFEDEDTPVVPLSDSVSTTRTH